MKENDVIETKVGSFEPEDRLLIDGELTEAASGARFDNVNPATEDVLGQVADGGHEDVQRAIAAARRAFDETDWSTNRAFRARCLEQLQEALEADREQMRAELVAETGTPVLITYGPQLDTPLQEAFRWPAKNIEQFDWERELPDSDTFGVRSRRMVVKEPQGVVGAIVPWNFPFEVTGTSSGRFWPPATRWCSSPRRTRRGTPRAWAGWSRRRPTSRRAWST
jgi:aldehyde dehydrogenase (NAD+)